MVQAGMTGHRSHLLLHQRRHHKDDGEDGEEQTACGADGEGEPERFVLPVDEEGEKAEHG